MVAAHGSAPVLSTSSSARSGKGLRRWAPHAHDPAAAPEPSPGEWPPRRVPHRKSPIFAFTIIKLRLLRSETVCGARARRSLAPTLDRRTPNPLLGSNGCVDLPNKQYYFAASRMDLRQWLASCLGPPHPSPVPPTPADPHTRSPIALPLQAAFTLST